MTKKNVAHRYPAENGPGDVSRGRPGRRRPGSAEGRIIIHEDFNDPMPEGALNGLEPREPEAEYAVVEMAEGGRVDRTQAPEGIELLIVDHDVYLEPMLHYTRADLEPYERCGSCGDVRMLHRDEGERSIMEGSGCAGFKPTGKTPVGDDLSEWEDD